METRQAGTPDAFRGLLEQPLIRSLPAAGEGDNWYGHVLSREGGEVYSFHRVFDAFESECAEGALVFRLD